ncbi:MAG: type II toxin-antitoxin system VapC family toxin [Methanobacteriota archaeon]|nr:MAG: type II toxin-antitoxin system VapC family toxin [Euryarchaeota archaeon]
MAGPQLSAVDASVAVKWFVPEADAERARSLREAHEDGRVLLAAPILLVYEVLNALRYESRIGADAAIAAARDLIDLQIALDPASPDLLADAVRLAYRTGLTMYDASYLALAERLGCPLYSADAAQLASAGGRGRHIREWE